MHIASIILWHVFSTKQLWSGMGSAQVVECIDALLIPDLQRETGKYGIIGLVSPARDKDSLVLPKADPTLRTMAFRDANRM